MSDQTTTELSPPPSGLTSAAIPAAATAIAATPATEVAEPEERGRLAHKWKVLISVLFGIFMIILDSTVINVAFQTLRFEFGATLNQAQWVISIYVLALG